MANCSFRKKILCSAVDLLSKAEIEIKKVNGNITGNADSGEFKIPLPIGEIDGTYIIIEDEVFLEITKKPFLIPCSLVGEVIENYLKEMV